MFSETRVPRGLKDGLGRPALRISLDYPNNASETMRRLCRQTLRLQVLHESLRRALVANDLISDQSFQRECAVVWKEIGEFDASKKGQAEVIEILVGLFAPRDRELH